MRSMLDEMQDDDFQVRMRGYCLFRIACTLIATIWLANLGHFWIGFGAFNVMLANISLRRFALRTIAGKIDDPQPRPFLVALSKTAFLWLLLAALIWWIGW